MRAASMRWLTPKTCHGKKMTEARLGQGLPTSLCHGAEFWFTVLLLDGNVFFPNTSFFFYDILLSLGATTLLFHNYRNGVLTSTSRFRDISSANNWVSLFAETSRRTFMLSLKPQHPRKFSNVFFIRPSRKGKSRPTRLSCYCVVIHGPWTAPICCKRRQNYDRGKKTLSTETAYDAAHSYINLSVSCMVPRGRAFYRDVQRFENSNWSQLSMPWIIRFANRICSIRKLNIHSLLNSCSAAANAGTTITHGAR